MPQKRKQTPDMLQSPPKRVTRARAKKDVEPKLDKTHIVTSSAKVSAQKTSGARSAKLLRSQAQDPEDGDVDHEPEVEQIQPDNQAPKTRGKAKTTSKPTVVAPKTPSAAPAKSTRSRSNKITVSTTDEAEISKPKDRPKRTAGLESSAVTETVEKGMEADLPVKAGLRATRGRAAAMTTSAPSMRARAAAAPKKRVQFEDRSEQDKENQPITADVKKDAELKATGLRAKPIRKPASTRGGTRGTRGTKSQTETETNVEKKEVLPLSPKKVTQVAKTPSVGSEDELNGEKSPFKIPTASSSKMPASASRGTELPLSEFRIETDNVQASPTRDSSAGKLAASPRKPPPSPFKNALKTSPRKFDLGSRPAAPKFDASSSPLKSPLRESPKRLNISDIKAQPVLQWSKTPLKSSLFQSPARRMGGSSMKTPSKVSPSKSSAIMFGTDSKTTSRENDNSESLTMTAKSASSPLQAARNYEQRPSVYDPNKERPSGAPASPESPNVAAQLEKNILKDTSAPENYQTLLKDSNVPEQADEATETGSERANDIVDEDTTLDFMNKSLQPSKETKEALDEQSIEDIQPTKASVLGVNDTPAPIAVPPNFTRPAFILSSPMIPDRVDDSESEDELASPQKAPPLSPLKSFGISAKDFGTSDSNIASHRGHNSSGSVNRQSSRKEQRASLAMTPLAMQMSTWLASSPEKKSQNHINHKHSIFSPTKPGFPLLSGRSPDRSAVGSAAKPCFFEDEMAVRDAEDAALILEEGSTDELQDGGNDDYLDFQASQESHESETYGDENAVPEEAKDLFAEQEEENRTLTCTPARVFNQQSREIHTVSKVPLRPAADDMPLIISRQRSRSLAGPLSVISMPDRLSISRDSILSPILDDRNLSMSMLPGDPTALGTPKTPTTGLVSNSNTPGRSIRKAGYSSVLKGAVVHVDVHTTEGADASGIFVDLLSQMGARCVKQWHWNPQGSLQGSSGDSPMQSPLLELGTPSSKLGITHVVYKDGGKRTLEKVREAKGAVLCVGVGWVLEYVLTRMSSECG